jgi:hypothetical protein
MEKWIDYQEYQFLKRFLRTKDITFAMMYLFHQCSLHQKFEEEYQQILDILLKEMKNVDKPESEEYRWGICKLYNYGKS